MKKQDAMKGGGKYQSKKGKEKFGITSCWRGPHLQWRQ